MSKATKPEYHDIREVGKLCWTECKDSYVVSNVCSTSILLSPNTGLIQDYGKVTLSAPLIESWP
eukprot:scaffold8605_cov178-Amphora_coffeaeformis.AAC.12